MLSHIKIKGTPFEVGQALGRFGAQAIHNYRAQSRSWATVMAWRDHPNLKAMAELVRQQQPRYWQEIEGLAAGLELPFADTFAWNCRGDVWAMAPDGCTTVQLPYTPYPAFAHNEDGDPAFAGQCALAEISVDGGTAFTSFVYPGSLPGHTIAVTASGLAMTVNNLRTQHVGVGLPRMLIARAMLDMPNIEAAIDHIRTAPRSGGFHFTFGRAGHHTLVSVEFNAALCSVLELSQPAVHANHMVHPAMRHQPQLITGSSGYRQIRGEQLLADARASGQQPDPLSILFDQNGTAFPIFRDAPDDSDQENTLATAVIQIGADAVNWQVHQSRSAAPWLRLRNGATI